MSRPLSRAAGAPTSAAAILALSVAVLVLVGAGCGSSGGHPAANATATTPRGSAPCKLNRSQRRTVARALADIRRLRRIQAPVQRFSQRGAPGQEAMTGKFLLDLGSAKLPPSVFSHLLHLAKAAVGLCGDCSTGLETEEPFLGSRSGLVCNTGSSSCCAKS